MSVYQWFTLGCVVLAGIGVVYLIGSYFGPRL
jgi:hypothetical protein